MKHTRTQERRHTAGTQEAPPLTQQNPTTGTECMIRGSKKHKETLAQNTKHRMQDESARGYADTRQKSHEVWNKTLFDPRKFDQ